MGSNNVSISVIVTTYNRKDALELVLLSLREQSVMPTEVIVADDGSTSDTADLVAGLKKDFPVPLIHCWHEDNGFRLSHIRNRAISHAKGDYIIMVDGDVVLHRHFVRDHRQHIAPNRFIQGSRVLLSKELTDSCLLTKRIKFSPFSQGIANRLNAVSSATISPWASAFYSRKQTHRGVRGCNMSYWKSDLIKVNGFSEEFIGWGREDSEFVVRMLNSGVERYNLKFAGVVYHLWHKENKSDALLQMNDQALALAIEENRKTCNHGLSKYLHQPIG
ncbi:MAG TPA: family 2 glycosyl transferase [Bacteroidales bacterium]|nr:family 2 glycosyl transferase [Bacteroidales bacterium]